MTTFIFRPCEKCGRTVWRLGDLHQPLAEFTCTACATVIFVAFTPEEWNTYIRGDGR